LGAIELAVLNLWEGYVCLGLSSHWRQVLQNVVTSQSVGCCYKNNWRIFVAGHRALCTNGSNTHRCSGFESSVNYASGKVQTVRPTNRLMRLICTGKKIRDGFVCIATTLRSGRSLAQIPILAIDFYLLQKTSISALWPVQPSLGMSGAIYPHCLIPWWRRQGEINYPLYGESELLNLPTFRGRFYSVEIPTRCSFVIEFIIPKFIEASTCFEQHTAHHQEL